MALLAVDLGLRTGLACYGREGRLLWYRSSNFGRPGRLRRAIPGIVAAIPNLSHLVMEGGGPLAEIWRREAERQRLEILQFSAEQWRRNLLLPRQQRSGVDAKRHADEPARQVISWSGLKRPTSLRHDAAEAILVGLYAARRLGWIADATTLPDALRG